MIRKPLYAGTWYPNERKKIEEYLQKVEKKEKVIACICPHAGWMYSGKTAGKVYSRIKPAETYILLGPNHTGVGENVSVYPDGSWETPIGKLEINSELVNELVRNSEFIQKDYKAHSREHSLEVQTPFIALLNPKSKIVPITIKSEDLAVCQDLARTITEVLKEQKNYIVLIASTDMTHYEPQEYAKKQDQAAIDEILKLDAEGLYRTVQRRGISMCGYIPTTIVIMASKLLGAKTAELVEYTTSGDITGDYSSVVGYAGLIIK